MRRSCRGIVLVVAVSLASPACSKEKSKTKAKAERPSVEMCERMGDHVAQLITDSIVADPGKLWDTLEDTSGFEAIGLTRETFAAHLQTEDGKTFIEGRKAAARAGMKEDLERCAAKGNKKQVECILAAPDRAAFEACLK